MFNLGFQNKIKLMALLLLTICASSAQASDDWVWDMLPKTPVYDVRWQRVDKLWETHWDGKNLDQIVALLEEIKTDHPTKSEPLIWLSRVHYIKANQHSSGRNANYQKSEEYAAAALRLDATNLYAFKNLLGTLPFTKESQAALNEYAPYFKSFGPLPSGNLVQPLSQYAEWPQIRELWVSRNDNIENGLKALSMIEELAAKNPQDGLVMTWLCRATYDMGQYYYFLGNASAMEYYKRAVTLGEKAMALDPYSVPANYWYELALARTIESESLMTQAKYIVPLVKHGLFCLRENPLYNYNGPALMLSTMITNGGWVTEKGMAMAGVSLADSMHYLDLGAVIYPTKFYIYFGKADVLAYTKKQADALETIAMVKNLNADLDPYNSFENNGCLKVIDKLEESLQK